MAEMTLNRRKVLDFVQSEVQAGKPVPTHREIAAKLNFKGHRAAAYHLEALERDGLIKSNSGKARSLRVTTPLAQLRSRVVDIPIFGVIPAGMPQANEQEAEGCVSVDVESIGIKPTRQTFALRVKGDSMIGKHICDGDIVVLEFGPEPRHGQIVAAYIDGASTLKTFLMRNGRPCLKAENPKYPDFIPAEELTIQGVFKALIRKAKE
ncbi:MAG: transcriptional repressor LexA [Verrucomicrobiota bacterium]